MLLEYRLESVLGAGGFGITYLCTDTNLDKRVAIKEYFPADLALRALDGSVVSVNTESDQNYKWGLERFIQEARTLAKFSHPHIVRVNRYFEANSTGYMVMDYENGESLGQLLKREPTPGEARVKDIVVPLLEGLQAVHETGFLHRDIKPSNIFIRTNGSPVLLDFGAARHAVSGSTKSLTAVLTPGYAPLEQYSGDGDQGPWSDIYAMAGVLYRVFTHENPPDAVSRLKHDPVPAKLAQLRGRVSEPALRAVDWALTLDEKLRPRTVEIWKRALQGKATVPLLTRTVAVPAPTQGVLAPTAAKLPITQAARRTTIRHPIEASEPSSLWRGIGMGLALLVALMGGRAWYTQREAEETARLEAARTEIESRAQEQRQADRRRIEEREAQLLEKERSAAEREIAARRAAEREEALRRLDEEQRARERITSAGDARKPPAAEELRLSAPLTIKRDVSPTPQIDASDKRGSFDGFEQKMQQDFRNADSNGDGHLTPDEVRGRMPFVEREFQRLDTNGDGRISMQEFMESRFLKPKPPPLFKK